MRSPGRPEVDPVLWAVRLWPVVFGAGCAIPQERALTVILLPCQMLVEMSAQVGGEGKLPALNKFLDVAANLLCSFSV